MEKITILNANNQNMQVDVVRYFSDRNNKYFIFSLNEVDAQGHMNIYVTKIVDQNGTIIGTNILDDVEWSNVKVNLQRIIKENRSGQNAVVTDLPFSELENIKVADRKALKLLSASVGMLNKGYNPVTPVEEKTVVEPVVEEKVETPIAEEQKVEEPVVSPIPEFNIPEPESVKVEDNSNIFDGPQIPIGNIKPVVEQNDTTNTEIINPFENNQNSFDINSIKPAEEPVVEKPVVEEKQPEIKAETGIDYKALYEEEKQKSEKLSLENKRLIDELNSYKIKISNIKSILSK